MTRIHSTSILLPEDDKYTRDEVMEIIKKATTDQDKMFHQMNQTMDILFYALHNNIAWISKTMEDLQQKLDYTQWIIDRQQDHRTRGE